MASQCGGLGRPAGTLEACRIDLFDRKPATLRGFALGDVLGELLPRAPSGTPDILRPGWIRPVSRELLPTYGVVLDTSGSMDRALLGKALGAIASYSRARDVPAARVVYCDAAAYDAGYVAADPVSPGPAL